MHIIDSISGKGSANPTVKRRRRAEFVRKVVVEIWSVGAWLEGRLEKRRSRLALLELTDDQLKDIGISRADAYREGLRSFWD